MINLLDVAFSPQIYIFYNYIHNIYCDKKKVPLPLSMLSMSIIAAYSPIT